MASLLNLRYGDGFALGLRERNLRGQMTPGTAMSGCATIRAGLVPGLRRIAPRLVNFGAVGYAKISGILIGGAAIRNRCKSLKVRGGNHF
jgi:hypothetical protein